MKTAFFDYAATTPMDARLEEVFLRHAREALNSSSIHRQGQHARRLLEEQRERLADLLSVIHSSDIVFTSGATEAANLAIRGLVDRGPRPLKITTSALEHSCVNDTLAVLEKRNLAELTWLDAGESGQAILDESSCAQAHMLCLMHSNNETGVLQNIYAARKLRGEGRFTWLCDACQSLGKVPLNISELGADLVVLSSHKVYGPVGVGCLIGQGLGQLVPQITGGPQEDEHRAGTQPLALIAAFVKAVEFAVKELDATREHLLRVEKVFLDGLAEAGVNYLVNGTEERLPGFLNISFEGVEAADAVIALDQKGFCVSPGSACSTGVVAVSPVLEAMYRDDSNRAAGGVRITFGRSTTTAESAELARAFSQLTAS